MQMLDVLEVAVTPLSCLLVSLMRLSHEPWHATVTFILAVLFFVAGCGAHLVSRISDHHSGYKSLLVGWVGGLSLLMLSRTIEVSLIGGQ
jgi:hypothetical protein